MEIKTWIKYYEGYLPPRCRKLRYRECEDYVDITLAEATLTDMSLAFEDNSYEGKGKIYYYDGCLWAADSSFNRGFHKYKSALEKIIDENANCSWYFPRIWRDGEHPDKEHMIYMAKMDMSNCLLVDGILFRTSKEPRYVINVFGLGHNHGGTGMFCGYSYNPNISRDSYFSALQGEEAVAYANKTAASRGDTNDVGRFKPFIVCHRPDLVKVDPNTQHGDGDKFLNTMKDVIESSNDTVEAGLLALCLCANKDN